MGHPDGYATDTGYRGSGLFFYVAPSCDNGMTALKFLESSISHLRINYVGWLRIILGRYFQYARS